MGNANECEGKTQYNSGGDCKGVLKHLNKTGIRMKSYKCSQCGFWHVGHERKTKLAPYVRNNKKIDIN